MSRYSCSVLRALCVAFCIACCAGSALAVEKVGDIPVPTDGLVVHIDAMTDAALAYHLDGGNYVTDFAFVGGTPRQEGGAILSAKGRLVGPFKSAVAPKPDEIRYRTHCVSYGLHGLFLFVK